MNYDLCNVIYLPSLKLDLGLQALVRVNFDAVGLRLLLILVNIIKLTYFRSFWLRLFHYHCVTLCKSARWLLFFLHWLWSGLFPARNWSLLLFLWFRWAIWPFTSSGVAIIYTWQPQLVISHCFHFLRDLRVWWYFLRFDTCLSRLLCSLFLHTTLLLFKLRI